MSRKSSPFTRACAPTSKKSVSELQRQRSKLLVMLATAAFAVLAGRACWIQIINHDFYVAEGNKRYDRTIALDATRGWIVDRYGAPLAMSLVTYEVWANPKLLDERSRAPLAKLLAMPADALARRLAEGKAFVLLQRQVDASVADRIGRLSQGGITLIADARRVYPEGESSAHVVGFTDIEDHGQEGIELATDAQLGGVPGQHEVIRDRLGRAISERQAPVPAHNGAMIRLTIDRRIQQLAYSQLKIAIARNNAQAGSVVVLDARNGEILALTNYPSFDPNRRKDLTGAQVRNRAVVDTFEPGSTIKPIVVALSIDEGKVRPQSIIDTTPGAYWIGRDVIHDTSNHGRITVAQAIQKSSNIALAKLALALPAQTIWARYQQYGLGHRPELAFPGAAPGRVRPFRRWHPVEQATMAYGYGLSTSLLQIAQVYTAYADDGVMHPATLLSEGRGDGLFHARPGRAVTTPTTAAAIRSMLEMAAGPGGTGRAAHVEGYRIGGKTGTARKEADGRYARNHYRALFVGMAPMSDPRVIVAVMIDDPVGGSFYGGPVAGPVFSAVTGGALRLLGVPPDVDNSPIHPLH
ncbi:peptidoglycan D,D-transpeptidase FtsI family protein [Paraburkholderia aspalathi]|uniref:peptidoglycan D,D-transpeptidase FtsI family protein n=1 Tax=Paraburkholderia aspalathi TaxID=1324617 RepID=UPI0038B8D188